MSESTLKIGDDISPSIDITKAKGLFEELYGYNCSSIKQLNGYDDRNFYVRTEKKEFVFKIMNKLDSCNIPLIEAHHQMMIYLHERGFNCPVPLKNMNGCYYSLEKLESGQHIVRLFTYLPGEIFYQMKMTDKNFFDVGKYIANFDLALKDFYHPAYDKVSSMWMLECLPKLKDFVYVIKDEGQKSMVVEIIEEFEGKVLKYKDKFEKGIIHGDFNEHNIVVRFLNHTEGNGDVSDVSEDRSEYSRNSDRNGKRWDDNNRNPINKIGNSGDSIDVGSSDEVIGSGDVTKVDSVGNSGVGSIGDMSGDDCKDVSWEISGILDFGDTQYSCLVFELAIAIAYMILQGKSLDVAGYVIAGYSTVRNIPEHEYEVLKVCVAGRLCQSLVLGAYSHTLHPENTYVLTTQKTGWKFLNMLWKEPTEQLYKKWNKITQQF